MSIYDYPLDTTGSAATNLVTGERHTLSPPIDSRDYHFIIARSGPYYRDTLKLIHEATGRVLVEDLDWTPGHQFTLASYETEYVQGGIYQTIVFLDRSLSGTVLLEEYQVLGGEWSLDENKVLELLSNKLHDPRQYTYEIVSGKPNTFPALRHSHPADDMVGQRELVEATMLIAQAIRNRTVELPPEIMAIMVNYYDKATLDSMLTDLTTSIFQGITGPVINQVVADSIQDILTQYVKLEVYSLAIDGLMDSIGALQTGAGNTTTKINNIQNALNMLSSTLQNTISTTGLEDRLLEFGEDYVTGTEFTTHVNNINITVNSLTAQISEANTQLQLLVTSLGDYVRKDELADAIPTIVLTESQSIPVEVDTVDVVTGKISGIFKYSVVSHTLRDGLIVSIELNTSNDEFVLIHKFQGDGYGPRDRLKLVNSTHAWDFIENWEADGYTTSSDALLSKSAGIVPYSPMQWAIYASIDYVTVVAEDTYRVNLRLAKIENAGVDATGTVLRIKDRVPAPTAIDSMLIGILGVSPTGQLITKSFVNLANITILETKSKMLSVTDMLTLDIVSQSFTSNFGHLSTSTVLGVKLFDPAGVLMGVSGQYHDFKPCVRNIVTVLKPKIDISSFGPDAQCRLEITVSTETK